MKSLRNVAASLAIAGAMTLVAGTAQASNVIFDFSGFSEGDVLNGTINYGGGVTGTISTSDFDPSRATGEAMIFNTLGGQSVQNDPDLEGPFQDVNDLSAPFQDFGNALILQEINGANHGPDDVASGGRITFTFDRLVTLTAIFILDGADNSPTGASIFLDDATQALVSGLGGGDNQFERFGFAPNTTVSSFSVDFAGSGAIGRFGFAVVPVPATLPLLLTGLGVFAWFARRRKRVLA